MAMQPTVSQLTLTSSYRPQFSNTSNTHMYTDFPSFLPSDRQAALFLHTEIFTQLFGRCCQPPPPFLLPPSSLSLSLSRLPKLILSPLPKNCSLKTGGTSPNLNQLKNAFILSSLLHRHSTRRKQRTSLTLWDLRPLLLTIHRRQPGVGAIYERFFFFLQLQQL